jgi:hypothetical protein
LGDHIAEEIICRVQLRLGLRLSKLSALDP